jgi:general secretion pathway protein F
LRAASVSLDQLIALNDEIGALVRVGVPLEEGLALIGEETPGAPGKLTQWVAQRMQQGQPLEQILADHPESFPPVYRAVVQAGLKTGHLSAALEAVATSVRRLAQTRRMIVAGMIYPLIVFLVAWGLFVLYTIGPAHMFLYLVDDFHLPGRDFFALLAEWGQSAGYWGPAVPLAVLLLAVLWWVATGRASLADPSAAGVLLGWIPGMNRMLRTYQVATFTDLFAMLVEHDVPLPEAVVLAADATGGRRLAAASRELASAVRRGEPLGPQIPAVRQFPPLLAWLMSRGQTQDSLSAALRQAAEMYHQRAVYQGEAARIFVPLFLTLVIGGGVTLVFALLVLGNWFTIVRSFT